MDKLKNAYSNLTSTKKSVSNAESDDQQLEPPKAESNKVVTWMKSKLGRDRSKESAVGVEFSSENFKPPSKPVGTQVSSRVLQTFNGTIQTVKDAASFAADKTTQAVGSAKTTVKEAVSWPLRAVEGRLKDVILFSVGAAALVAFAYGFGSAAPGALGRYLNRRATLASQSQPVYSSMPKQRAAARARERDTG